MQFTEFMQMVVRVAILKFYDTDYNFELSIAKKVEYFLDDIFYSIGIFANNPKRILHRS